MHLAVTGSRPFRFRVDGVLRSGLTTDDQVLYVKCVTANCAVMRIPTSKLQQLTIYTTVLTGGGIGTMYYLMQKNFVNSEYHRLAVARLEMSPAALEGLGAPPLKVHNIHLSDRDNRVDQHTAKVKIPVTGSKTGGYLYTISTKNPATNGWQLKLATLQLKEGQTFNLLNPPDQPSVDGDTAL